MSDLLVIFGMPPCGLREDGLGQILGNSIISSGVSETWLYPKL